MSSPVDGSEAEDLATLLGEGGVLNNASILDNAVRSIRSGVAAYATHDPEQMLLAVQCLHSGVLLLYKEALRRCSPEGTDEVLLKEKIEPRLDGGKNIVFVGTGKRTVTTQQIKVRFAGLKISTDWKRFQRVADVRNEVEHYFSSAHPVALQELVADAFVLVRDFMLNELEEDPCEILGSETWELMLSAEKLLDHERAVCEKAVKEIKWHLDGFHSAILSLRCVKCGSPLLMPTESNRETDLTCRTCGHSESSEDFTERAVSQMFAPDSYSDPKEDCNPLYITCPFCCRDSYIVAEKLCATCGESCTHTCLRCENSIPPEELSDGEMCGYCDHQMS
jgi:hypothetical protein